jgi:flagellar motor protein MotB
VRHFRSLAIALVVLGLSTGAVFAAKTISDAANASNTGLAHAQAVSGQTPASGSGPQAAPAKGAEPDEQADETTGTDSTTGTGKPTDNHGAVVSSAAQLSFDDLKALCATSGFVGTNKGAYMSAIARGELVVTVAKVTDATTGTGIVAKTCAKATASTTGTATKLHGKANAAAKQAAHQPHP